MLKETYLIAGIGACAAVLAAIITARFNRPSIIVVEQDGRRTEHSKIEVLAAIRALQLEEWKFNGLQYSSLDALRAGFHVVINALPRTSETYSAKSFHELIENVTRVSISNEVIHELKKDEQLSKQAARLFEQLLASFQSLNIITNYRADSAYHSVNCYRLTDFGAAVLKQVRLYPPSKK
jgi:hypothetical protein